MAKEKQQPEKEPTNGKLRAFNFPKFGKVIKARSIKEANEILQKSLNIKPKDNG